MKMYSLLCIALMAMTWTSCDSSNDEPPKKSEPMLIFEISGQKNPADFTIPPRSYLREFAIKSNGAWRIETDEADTWFTVTPSSGENNAFILITAESNTEDIAREGKLTFYLNNNKHYTFTLKQLSKELYFSASPKTATIAAGGGDATITITTNIAGWQYTIKGENSSWLTEKSKTVTSVTFTANRNATEDELTAAVEFINPNHPDFKQEVTFTQSGQPSTGPKLLFDLAIDKDGNGSDASEAANVVTTVPGTAMTTYYHTSYGRYVANFKPTATGVACEGYYKVEYKDNQTFKDELADGHTMEIVCMYDSEYVAREIKMFSSQQSGGTGFLLKNSAENPGQFTFLPNVSTDGKSNWRWGYSGVIPAKGTYYHVIGVYDKVNGKVQIYVNGELKGTVESPGNLIFATDACKWFCIGGDPSSATTADGAWRGDIVIARIYEDAITATDVTKLWNKVKDKMPK